MPPTTAVDDPAFDPCSYWRGPTWPVTWLLWWALDRDGCPERAGALRSAAIAQLRDAGCSEYAHPLTGEPLGSVAQSWTAAVALDWLAAGPDEPGRPAPPRAGRRRRRLGTGSAAALPVGCGTEPR